MGSAAVAQEPGAGGEPGSQASEGDAGEEAGGAGDGGGAGEAGAPQERGPTSIDPEADQRARQHFLVGRSYFEQARFEEAAREFAEAYELSGYPALLINLGMAQERALAYDEAIEAYARYLEVTEPGAQWREAAEQRSERLRAIRARQEKRSGADAAGDGGLSGRDVWGFSLMGAGVLAGVAALVTMLKADGIHSELQNECLALEGFDDLICDARRADDIDRGRRLAIASWSMIGTAVAAGAVGALLWLLDEPQGERPETAPRVGIGVGRGGASASLGWRF